MKYYKVEDVINTLADQWRFEAEMESPYPPEDIEEWKKVARELFADLPTIEVSEEMLKSTKKFNCYTIADENAEMGMRTQIEPILEVSEDCISREWLVNALVEVNGESDMPSYWHKGFNSAIDFIKHAPSVVPSKAEGEWYRQTTDQFDYWECSECGMGVGLDDIKNYCPNCGARMEIEE